jgi:hypothetical protein
MKFVKHGNASNVRRQLGMLNETKLFREKRAPRIITLFTWSAGKGTIEVHVVM